MLNEGHGVPRVPVGSARYDPPKREEGISETAGGVSLPDGLLGRDGSSIRSVDDVMRRSSSIGFLSC